ncbi:hypothetical protein BX070DRAFT_229383 [Coemansia spiralis]|nr:hypothetical protein BX070DRAFT_229383 [Coemansia spiralis]
MSSKPSDANSIFEYRSYPLPTKYKRVTEDVSSLQYKNTRDHGKQQPHYAFGYLSPSSTRLVEGLVGTQESHSCFDDEDDLQANLYCAVCKKKFANPATFTAHQQSDKHKKNLRVSSSKSKAQPSKAGKEKQAALESLKKAQAIMQKDPAVAATVLWNIAKDIARYSDTGLTESVLVDVLDCMRRMESDPSLRGAKGSPASWSVRSLLKTMLDCRLALARLLSTNNKEEAAKQYNLALCNYLGIPKDAVSNSCADHSPLEIYKQTSCIAAAVPRKFAKEEDVAQAIKAMDETASALLAFANEDQDALLWQGIALHMLQHAFALCKGNSSAAYNVILKLISCFKAIGMGYFANECAALIIEHHMSESDAKAQVAFAVMSSILSSDLVRAARLAKKYSNACDEPWTRYMEELIKRRSMLDTAWMCNNAWAEWTRASLELKHNDHDTFAILNDGIDKILSPYKWCFAAI